MKASLKGNLIEAINTTKNKSKAQQGVSHMISLKDHDSQLVHDTLAVFEGIGDLFLFLLCISSLYMLFLLLLK